MQSRLQGEQDYQTMLKDIVDQSQSQISVLVEKKRLEQEEARAKREAAEEAARLKNLEKSRLEEEEKKKLEAERAKTEAAAKKATEAVISKEGAVKKAKRKNVVKMGAGKMKDAELLKMKKEMEKKKAKGAPATPALKVEEEKKEEEKSEEPMKKEAVVAEKPAIKFLELTPNEERDIKQKIYMNVYEEFLKIYQGNFERVKPLC